jgi:hypothetical protein
VPRTALHRPHWILVSDAAAESIGLIVRLPQPSQTILNSEFSNIIIFFAQIGRRTARHEYNKDEVLSSQLDDRSESSDLLKRYRTSTGRARFGLSVTLAPRSAPKGLPNEFPVFCWTAPNVSQQSRIIKKSATARQTRTSRSAVTREPSSATSARLVVGGIWLTRPRARAVLVV